MGRFKKIGRQILRYLLVFVILGVMVGSGIFMFSVGIVEAPGLVMVLFVIFGVMSYIIFDKYKA